MHDWEAATIIGLRVPRDKIMDSDPYLYNNCTCNPQVSPEKYPDAKFCPHCGQLLKRNAVYETVRDAPLFKNFDEGDESKNKIAGWLVYGGTGNKFFYIGPFLAINGRDIHATRTDFPSLAKLNMTVEQFKRDMKEAGLWDPSEFGIWTVLTRF